MRNKYKYKYKVILTVRSNLSAKSFRRHVVHEHLLSDFDCASMDVIDKKVRRVR